MSWMLLGRPECGLCEEFLLELRAAIGDRVPVSWIDVDEHPEWRRRYGDRIPVLLDAQGLLLMETRFDPARLPPL